MSRIKQIIRELQSSGSVTLKARCPALDVFVAVRVQFPCMLLVGFAFPVKVMHHIKWCVVFAVARGNCLRSLWHRLHATWSTVLSAWLKWRSIWRQTRRIRPPITRTRRSRTSCPTTSKLCSPPSGDDVLLLLFSGVIYLIIHIFGAIVHRKRYVEVWTTQFCSVGVNKLELTTSVVL